MDIAFLLYALLFSKLLFFFPAPHLMYFVEGNLLSGMSIDISEICRKHLQEVYVNQIYNVNVGRSNIDSKSKSILHHSQVKQNLSLTSLMNVYEVYKRQGEWEKLAISKAIQSM